MSATFRSARLLGDGRFARRSSDGLGTEIRDVSDTPSFPWTLAQRIDVAGNSVQARAKGALAVARDGGLLSALCGLLVCYCVWSSLPSQRWLRTVESETASEVEYSALDSAQPAKRVSCLPNLCAVKLENYSSATNQRSCFGPPRSQNSKQHLTSKSLYMVLRKKEAKLDYWPRLTKEKVRLHNVKTDFDKVRRCP